MTAGSVFYAMFKIAHEVLTNINLKYIRVIIFGTLRKKQYLCSTKEKEKDDLLG